jgi:hypothetical protein
MANITNLTPEQLNTELGVNAFSFDDPTDDILLSLKTLTGDTYTGLTNLCITEVIHKLITACQEAQVTVNSANGVDTEEQLRSFPPSTTGAFDPTTLKIPIRHSIEVSLSVDPNNVIGVNI